jgi:hypothetical protein
MEVSQFDIATRRARVADFLELTKPRITFLVLVTTLVGFYMASREALRLVLLFHTILGTALVAGGASALNQYFERDLDARMLRTRNRPLPEGRVIPGEALRFSAVISLAGIVYLSSFVNPLTGLLGALTLAAYIFVYTPLKKRTGRASRSGQCGVEPIRDSLSMANAALLCDCLGFYRGLHAGRIHHARKRRHDRAPDYLLLLRTHSYKPGSNLAWRNRWCLLSGRYVTGLCLSRLWCCRRALSLKHSRATPPASFHPVSASFACSHDAR